MSADHVLTPEEWTETSTELAIIRADPAEIESADPQVHAAMVTQALQESRSWLTVAMRSTDPTPIAEFKAWAATVEEATRQKKLGREIELDAAEMVRRAERGIGVAIRRGQEAGEIAKRGDIGGHPGRGRGHDLARPADFLGTDELRDAAYPLATASDEQFEDVISEAKAEGNLSRANVVRKVKNQPAPKGKRHELLHKTRHHDANRIVEQTVIGLEGYVLALPLIDFEQLDRARVPVWSNSLSESLRSLNRLSRQLKEMDQTGDDNEG